MPLPVLNAPQESGEDFWEFLIKLPGIIAQIVRFMNGKIFFHSCHYPCFFCILSIGNGAFNGFPTGNASGQIR